MTHPLRAPIYGGATEVEMRHVLFAAAFIGFLIAGSGSAVAEGEPSADELAAMILDGNEAEHALVAAWLESADRAELIAVFRALRIRRSARRVPLPATQGGHDATDPSEPLPQASHLVNIETHVIEVDARVADAVLGHRRPAQDARSLALTVAEAESIMKRVEASPKASVVAAPRITVYDNQKCNVSMLNQISYVKDYEVEVADVSVIADPVIGIIQEGITLDMRPTITADKKKIIVSISSTHASVARPIPQKKINLKDKNAALPEPHQEVTIQVPEVHVTKFTVDDAAMPDAGWLLIGSGKKTTNKEGKSIELVSLVRAEVIELQEHELLDDGINLIPDNFDRPRIDVPKKRRK